MSVTGETRLVGLIGSPVSHSLSPRMQNAGFAALALDWAYVPLPVERDRLEDAVAGLAALGFAGANVTIPYKTAVLGFCDELDPVAERAGSVNTLVVAKGRIVASSTDGPAVVGLVEAAGARVLVLGAGGGAQAVATALADAGAESITIAARDAERAHALEVRLRTLFPEREIRSETDWPPPAGDSTLIVNATPVLDEAPVQPAPGHQVVDLSYRPDSEDTALVLAARKAGCDRVVDGLEVLLAQGTASFERWTGLQAPVDVMRAALGR
ncbi:MAG: shikimate dehydrogenase [Gaiellaceae bacterium]